LGGSGGIEREGLGLLGGMRVLSTLVDLQLAEQLTTEGVVG
jgi:hypothetical protein